MNNTTYYQLILDSSGSMRSVAKETIDSFNEQIQAIRDLKAGHSGQDIRVSLTTFDSFIDFTFDRACPEEVPELTRATYRPRRLTALCDAMGDSIQRLRARVGDEIAADRATAVVVTLTDGYENASKRYASKDVAAMIKELQGDGSWTFSFLGADIDAYQVAAAMQIRRRNTRCFAKKDVAKTFGEVNAAMDEHIRAKIAGMKKRDLFD